MQDIVDRFNLRSTFETEEVRDKLKMAGLRGQAPLVAHLFFRLAMPIIIAVIALVYLFLIAAYDSTPD
jgi:tight adherence protein C